jgi:D-arabinonate dehydratase
VSDPDLRIEGIDALAVDIPLTRNFGGSTYAVLKRSTVITRMRTTGGLVSEVYNGDNREHGPEIVRLIREVLAPRVRGLGILEAEQIWERLFALSHASRDRKTLLEAIACVDSAVWDLAGRALGQSVCALLGGHRRQLPIITIGGYYMPGKTLADIGAEMEAYRRAGMAGCKFKVGGLAPEEDARRVEAARRAAGPDFVIAVDANRGWSVGEAVRFARLIEPLDIRWFEEPCHWHDDAAMMARVRAATRIPITAGQSEITSHGVRRLVEAGAVDFVNFDASEGGGITEWRRAAALCRVAGVEMAHHEEPQIARHLLAAVSHGTYVECFADPERDPVWQAMWANRPSVKDGMIELSSDPGFGLVLDEAMIRRYRVA